MLYFRAGPPTGFTAETVATQEPSINIPVREMVQNALDASLAAKNEVHKVKFAKVSISVSDIPFLDKYESVLSMAEKTLTADDSFNDNSQIRVDKLRTCLQQKKLAVLLCSDNGIGMDRDGLAGLLNCRSRNRGAGSTGSFGVGHQTALWMSDLDYVFYVTKTKGGGAELYTGQANIAGHNDQGVDRGAQGIIIDRVPKNELSPEFDFIQGVPEFLCNHLPDFPHGTTVAIIALNNDWNLEVAKYCVASNFFKSISDGKLEVNFSDEFELNKRTIEEVLKQHAGEKNRSAQHSQIVSGEVAWNCYSSVIGGIKVPVRLSSTESSLVHISHDVAYIPTIVLVRNGMLIARHDDMHNNKIKALRNENVEPFNVVIEADHKSAPEFHRLVLGAENHYHNKLMKKKLGAADEKQLKKSLDLIAKTIRKNLPEIERDSHELPLFRTAVASSVHKPPVRAKRKLPKPPPKPRPIPPGPNPAPRPKPTQPNRALECKSAMRYRFIDNFHLLDLKVKVHKMDSDDVAYLVVAIAEDSDNMRFSNYVPISEIKQVDADGSNDIKLSKLDADRQVEMENLTAGKSIELQVKLNMPEISTELSKLALSPMLGVRKKVTS